MFTFKDIQDEVKRGAIRDQAGTTFDVGIKNIINRALYRLAREANWKPLRRKTNFNTVTSYTEGTGAVSATADSTTVTVTGATFITDGIQVGRRVTVGDSSTYYYISQVDSETQITLNTAYDGTTTTTGSYSILPQEEYNVPIQAGYNLFMWHEQYGAQSPYMMNYVQDQEFYGAGIDHLSIDIPTDYRMWGENMVINQPLSASVVTIASSSAADTSKNVTVFGTVSGYPDSETITTDGSDGTTGVSGSKSFSSIERVVKTDSMTGRITATTNSGNCTVAVIPTGDQTNGIQYRKVQLYPLPSAAFRMNVQYYKYPFMLVNDGDVHELGGEFDQALIFLSIALLKYENNQDEGDKFLALYKDELRVLKRTNIDKIDWLPKLKRPSQAHMGNYGPHPFINYSQWGANYGPRVW